MAPRRKVLLNELVNKARQYFLIAALVFFAVLAACWCLRPSPEPVYQGRTLTEWLLLAANFNAPTNAAIPSPTVDEARLAIRQIGSNGVPNLLRMVRARDLPVKTNLLGQLERLKLLPTHYTTAVELNNRGRYGFRIMGREAASAVPELINLVDHGAPDMALNAVYSLSCIGPSARAAGPASAACGGKSGPGHALRGLILARLCPC